MPGSLCNLRAISQDHDFNDSFLTARKLHRKRAGSARKMGRKPRPDMVREAISCTRRVHAKTIYRYVKIVYFQMDIVN